MQKTMSFFLMVLQKDFTAFCNQKLHEIGLTQGLLYFIIYVGKRPGCSTGEMIKALHIDWGHAQRSIDKLVQEAFIIKEKDEKDKRAYRLTLTSKGEEAFDISHRVFSDWDALALSDLSAAEKEQLFIIMNKLVLQRGEYACVRNNQHPD